ncbi:MAG: hypothetical protein GXP62_05640 [Oligoflexia bacterium]|nr:hypothetical protein [Oligoflexia bacterium]
MLINLKPGRTGAGAAALLALLAVTGTGCSSDPDARIISLYQESADPLRGGQLYDEWWKVDSVEQAIEPGGTAQGDTGEELTSSLDADNPYYMANKPADNTRSGADTWRCKECHGWDYRGADGIYGSGSHYTGFKGVYDAADKTIPELYATIARGELSTGTDTGHAFNQVLNDQDIVDLIAFVREATVDVDNYIDPDTKEVLAGNVDDGKVDFDGNCATCHGEGGDLMNFHAGQYDSEFVADVATENPWEIFHKIRFGQPGEAMPNATSQAYLLEDVASVLAYAQTLGTPGLNGSSMWRGGALYDRWWKVTGADDPTDTNPMYTDTTWSAGTKTGADTWRCKECHGWDYKGVDGRYGSGSHYTGIKGIFDAQDKSIDSLYDAIYSGKFSDAGGTATVTDSNHAFGDKGLLSETDALGLVRFVKEGLVDDNDYIDGYTTRSLGSSAAGQGAFDGNCYECHQPDGTGKNFEEDDELPAVEYIGTVARDNPWEIFHKIRYGQPGSDDHLEDGVPDHMPNSLDVGYTVDDAANILAWAQKLPDSVTRGGQLYDAWWEVPGIDEPIEPGGSIVDADGNTVNSSVSEENPYFTDNKPSSNTQGGADTWRCKECHGWDYLGADGAYGKGSSHYTGIPGVFDTHIAADSTAIYDAIANGPSGMSDSHAFLPMIGENGVRDLTNYILDGVIDTTELVDENKRVTPYDPKTSVLRTRNADWVWGQMDYDGICANCHGLDGQAINFDNPDWEVVGLVVTDNPWEFISKIRFGQPGADPLMPSAAGHYFDYDDLADIISYAQSLPTE